MRIDGKLLAEQILSDLTKRVIQLESHNIIPHLAIIKIGQDPATTAYVNQKDRMGKRIGAEVSIYNCPVSISEQELLHNIEFLQQKGTIHGLIIQLPLPAHINEERVTQAVDASLDVDGFRKDSDFMMPIAAAVLKILEEIHSLHRAKKNSTDELKEFKQWLRHQSIVILGKGKTGGKPIIDTLSSLKIPVIVIDSTTKNIHEIVKTGDIVIAAVGKKGTIINESDLKKDAILIGIGMHQGADGKLHGDYDNDEIKDIASYYTPVPGGVGPVNAAMLLVNVVKSAEKQIQ